MRARFPSLRTCPEFLSLWLYSWQPPTVCLFNVFTELPVAIYPVVPPCQSSGVRANWHSRCSLTDRPICSDRYPSQEELVPGGEGEKQNYCRGTAWISNRQTGCVYFSQRQGIGACTSKERVIHATENSAVRRKTYLCKHCSICHLVRSVHRRCSWALDKFLWLSPSGRSGRTGQRTTLELQCWGQMCTVRQLKEKWHKPASFPPTSSTF